MENKTSVIVINKTLEKFRNRSAVVAVVGLGYVGLPLALRYAELGYRVIGFDINEGKIKKLMAGESYIQHIPAKKIIEARSRSFEATTDWARVGETDALILCVPTPLNKYREPDMSFVINTTDAIIPYLQRGQVLSLESTTYPGTTEEELLPRVESRGFKVGQDVFLVYSPEREDPGNKNFTTHSIPKIVGGHTPACLEVGKALYGQAIEVLVPVSSTKAAELTKLLENIHRAVNIGLVNEMKIVADRMGVDIHEVISAAATKPFGFTPYSPGPGLGGHCIPIDPFYLTWKAREYNLQTRFIELAGEVNANMPRWVLGKITDALNERCKSLKGAKVLVLGVAYKKNVDDTRESPALALMHLLEEKGAMVQYTDPHVPVLSRGRERRFDLASVDLTPQNIANYDLLLLATDHEKFDYKMIKKSAQLIVDTRGIYLKSAGNIVKA